jgi:hypothetical protein
MAHDRACALQGEGNIGVKKFNPRGFVPFLTSEAQGGRRPMSLYLGAARSVVRRTEISDAIKENLKARYEGYNPAELYREITRLQEKKFLR